MRNVLFIFAFFAFFSACTTKELPVPRAEQGKALIGEVFMGENYDYQIFYSLKQNAVVAKSLKTTWDIAFESGEEGYHVILNSSKFMFAFNTGNDDFYAVPDTSGFEAGKALDASSGHLDSTAIGDWRDQKNVFILDRGNGVGGKIGFVKLQVNSVDDSGYDIRFCLLPDGEEHSVHIPKDEAYNFSFLSFDNGGEIVSVEPPKVEWDLCFTQFTVQLAIPYQVTGVLLNSYQTYAQIDSISNFDDIDLALAQRMELSDANDLIGYEWKHFEFNASTYVVYPFMNYIIKDQEGVYYKMHFIDFYNNEGVKGNPKWEFVQL